ncbi:MAG: flagellar motor protein MotB [Xanthomonadales bacterium]|nr:flagellar motor protein MotB [Xanthomonadales bacterium]
MSDESSQPIIIVRKVKRGHGGHHGGSWKVAYADFVTAMMAFFLVMWILGVSTSEQRAAISAYFQNPSATPGTATVAPPGKVGPGGASDAVIDMGGGMNRPHSPDQHQNGRASAADAETQAREQERARLEELKKELQAAIEKSQALAPFKDQLLIDITPNGLRIQIVDKLNRPMFDTGSATLKNYTIQILVELAKFINRVPNRITLSGHTDDAPYTTDHHYSNWELSADRANAARRALLQGGLDSNKITEVVGLAAAVPLDKTHPGNPINRRISILVMTKQAEEAALSQGLAESVGTPAGAASATGPAPAAQVSIQVTTRPAGTSIGSP